MTATLQKISSSTQVMTTAICSAISIQQEHAEIANRVKPT